MEIAEMMYFDNRSGGKLYTTNATHGDEYQKKLQDLQRQNEIQLTMQQAQQAQRITNND